MRQEEDRLLGAVKINMISTVWEVDPWRALRWLSCVTLVSLWLLLDWNGSSIHFQTWTKFSSSESTSESTDAGNDRAQISSHWNASTGRTLHARGLQILHSYADDELIELALQAEGRFSSPHNDPLKLHPEIRPTSKIAFLFLTVADVPLEPLWRKFLQGHEKFYNVYVHSDPSWLRKNGSQERLGLFWGRTVPSAATHRSDPNIVAAERRLLTNALLDDPLNEWFVLVSESCIPLRKFSSIYQSLNATTNSFIDCGKGAPGPMMMVRYLARGETAMLPEVPFSEFRLGLQFFAIRRRHAVMVIRDKKYWSKFKLPCIRNTNTCYPDEHYVQTVIGNLDEPACKGTPTFLSWNGTTGGHPHSFGGGEITPHLIEAMRATQSNRFLFARKFRRDALEPLLALSDLLFK